MMPIRSTPYRDRERSASPILRASGSAGASLLFVVLLSGACVGFALAAMDAEDPFLLGMGALLSGTSAVGMLVSKVLRAPGHASCPECGTRIADLDRGRRTAGILCRCGRFLEVTPAGLRATPLDAVAERPTFGATMPGKIVWPPGCVVCGAPPTQHLPLPVVESDDEGLAKLALGAAMVATVGVLLIRRSERRLAIDVPHCPEHDDGVIATAGGSSRFLMLFRSYAYQRAFRVLNGAVSVESPDTHRSKDGS